MGYTHYWKKQSDDPFDPKKWDEFIKDAQKILNTAKVIKIPVQYELDDTKPPQLDKEILRFNGVDDDGHETFFMAQAATSSFEFCKTAHKPYDIYVTAILVLAKSTFGDDLKVSSDGKRTEWLPGIDLCMKTVGYGEKFELDADV